MALTVFAAALVEEIAVPVDVVARGKYAETVALID